MADLPERAASYSTSGRDAMQQQRRYAQVCAVVFFVILIVALCIFSDTNNSTSDADDVVGSYNNTSRLENDTLVSLYPWSGGYNMNKTNNTSDDTSSDYGGPISDFISITDIAQTRGIKVSSRRDNKCSTIDTLVLVRFTLTTDDYPWETSWRIIEMKEDSLAETIAFGPPRGKNYERRTRYIGEFCLEQGKVYKLRMKDRNNDGLCCSWGEGSYSITINGEKVISSDDSNFMVKDHQFAVKAEEQVGSQKQQVKTLYVIRHAEHGKDCSSRGCFEVLNGKGKTRAEKLANWFKNNGVVDKITHIFASHKPRTALTVVPVAKMANVDVNTFPKGGSQSLDREVSVCPTVKAIRSAPKDSTIIVAVHGHTVYKILDTGYDGYGDVCDGLGLDTSNQAIFPKDYQAKIPDGQYSNLWKVTIDADGNVKLDEHLILNFGLD